MTMVLSTLLRPFFLLIILVVIGIPVTMAVKRWMPPSRFKNLLLDRTFDRRNPLLWILCIVIGYGFIGAIGWFAMR